MSTLHVAICIKKTYFWASASAQLASTTVQGMFCKKISTASLIIAQTPSARFSNYAYFPTMCITYLWTPSFRGENFIQGLDWHLQNKWQSGRYLLNKWQISAKLMSHTTTGIKITCKMFKKKIEKLCGKSWQNTEILRSGLTVRGCS